MITIKIFEEAGVFAENKDIARKLRLEKITPAIERGEEVILDFIGTSGATQSFVHALISELFRLKGPDVLDFLNFKNCNDTVKKIIAIVTDYMQEAGE